MIKFYIHFSRQMCYTTYKEVRAFALSPYLRACIKFAMAVNKLVRTTSSSITNLVRFFFCFFFFFLLICLSPPYKYIILYGAPYIKRFFVFLLTNMELSMFILLPHCDFNYLSSPPIQLVCRYSLSTNLCSSFCISNGIPLSFNTLVYSL